MRKRHPTHGYDHSYHGVAKSGRPRPTAGAVKMAKYKNTVKTASKTKRPETNAEQASTMGRMYE